MSELLRDAGTWIGNWLSGGAPVPGVDGSVPVPGAAPGTAGGSSEPSGFAAFGQQLGDLGRGIAQEGAAGQADIPGLLDRQAAQRELAGKLDIVPDDFVGPKLPNQVTQAEYEETARLYSDVRLGRSDIVIDSSTSLDPAQYEADMMDDLGDILQTESGRTLLAQLDNNQNGIDPVTGEVLHRTTTIAPLLDPAGVPIPTAGEEGNLRMGHGSPMSNAPGVGTDTTVAFNPNLDAVAGGGRFRSDVALYHELVHAYHDTRGTTDVSLVTADDGWMREERSGDQAGLADEMLNPDAGVASDAANGVARWEHQAAGLGLYAEAPLTENAYRRERNELAMSGEGLPGDLTMPQRDVYQGYTGTYTPVLGF